MWDIEPKLYQDLYYNFILIVCLFYLLRSSINRRTNQASAIFLFVAVVCFIGLRPISIVFGDTIAYARGFLNFDQRDLFASPLIEAKDVGWSILSSILYPSKSVTLLFTVCAILYLGPPLIAFKEKYNNLYSIALLIFICSFSFWGFGVNGLRNGISTSFLILGFYSRPPLNKILFFIIAVSMHKSALLPIGAYLISYTHASKKTYLYIWCACIVLSLAVGEHVASYIEVFDIFGSDNRLSLYIAQTAEQTGVTFSSMGFRFDFLLYSSVPIYIGYKYMNDFGKDDTFYRHLFITYILCNAFWLFTIYIPYNNRFAYLSWFLYPILISHPYLTKIESDPQRYRYAIIKPCIFLNYAFTYFMFIK